MWSYLLINYNMTRACFQSSLFAKWIFLYNFCSSDCHCFSLLQLQKENKVNGLYGSSVKYFLEQTMSMDPEAVKSPYNLPLERVWPFIWTNLNPLHQWLLSAKFGWNWTSGSGVVNVFSLLSPFEDGCGPSFAQTWIPNTKGCLVPRMVEIW